MMLFSDKPSKAAVASVQYLSYVFLLGAVAAAVAWIVYVAKWNLHIYNEVSDGTKTSLSVKDDLASDRYTICYQAVVASVLIYFALRHMHHHMEA